METPYFYIKVVKKVATHVGSISVNVNFSLNNSSLRSVNNSINNLQNQAPRLQSTFTAAFGKIGAAMAAAFSVKAIVAFTKEATNLASELEEVQNVVNVVFGDMTGEMDKFAKNAMRNFGMGETAAKKYSSTYAAMAQSFGFTNEEVLMLAKSMTQLVGDTASFRNVSHDIANTKLKAIFTGETEALKEWGIVMTQAALQEFAYSRGITTKIQKMTEQEKVILRYNFVMSKLHNDMGDFQRTQAGWANQTRMLSDKISTIVSTFGSGFITILTPAIQALNSFLDILQTVANKFASFVALLFGKDVSVSEEKAQAQIDAIGASASSGAEDLEDLADGYTAAGKAAAKATESLASFDNVIQLADGASGGSGSGAGAGAGGGSFGLDHYEFTDNSELKESKTILDGIGGVLDKLRDKFSSVFEISDSIKPAVEQFAKSYVNALKTTATSFLEVGKSIGKSLIGGISLWLEQGKGRISEQWSTILFNFADGFDSLSFLLVDLEHLLTNFFSLETTQQTIANAMTMVEGFVTGSYLVISDVFAEINRFISLTISDNYTSIEKFFTDTSALLESLTGTMSNIVLNLFQSVHKNFEKYIRPAFTQFQEGFSKAFGTVVDAWNTYISPLLLIIADSFDSLWTNHLSPFVDEVVGMAGAFIEAVMSIINVAIKPALDFFINSFLPPLMVGISGVWGAVETLVGEVIDRITDLVQFLKGVFEVIAGLFQGDWQKICDGFKNIFYGLVRAVVGIMDSIVNVVIGGINGLIKGVNKIKIPGTEVGVNIPLLPKFQSQTYLADGGIVYRETNFGNFVAGEAGAEAIVPLENSEYTRILAREIVAGMLDAGMGGDTYNISTAYLDKRGLEKLTQDINGMNKQLGARKGVIAYG
jgi:hypothetical protein